MKLTKRETLLLAVLMLIALIFVEYKVVVVPGMAHYEKLKEQDQQVKMKVDETNMLISNLPKVQARRNQLVVDIDLAAKPFFDNLKPDALMRTTYDLIITNGLSLKNVTTTDISATKLTSKDVSVAGLTYQLKTLADDFANASTAVDTASKANSPTPTPAVAKTEDSSSQVESYSVKMIVSGTYDQVKQFLRSIESLGKTSVVPGVAISSAENGVVNADITINYYGVSKISDHDDKSNSWNQPAYVPGSGNPFSQIVIQPTTTLTPTPSVKPR